MNKPRLGISTQRRSLGDSLAEKVQLGVNVKIKEVLIVLSLNKEEKDPPLEPFIALTSTKQSPLSVKIDGS